MNKKQIAHLLVATLLAVPVSLLKAQSSLAVSGTTSFKCMELRGHPSGATYATVPFRNGRRLPPMILWKRTVGRWTPEARCKEVTPKFNIAVDFGQRNLSDLWLTTGIVNSEWVICYVNNTGQGCNSNNMLWTLTGENRRNPQTAVENLIRYRTHPAATDPTVEDRSDYPPEFGARFYYNLGALIDSAEGQVDNPPDSDYDDGPI